MGAVTRRVALAGLLLLAQACASARDAHYRALDKALLARDFAAANAQLKAGAEDVYGGRDALLAPLDQAMVALDAGDTQACIAACEQAKAQMEALFTKHVGEHVEAYVLGDNRLPYVGEPFERVAVHLLEALAYLAEGHADEAQVEARAMQATLRKNAALGEDSHASYTDDAFARWLSGLLLADNEADLARADEAAIDLQRALHLYETQDAPRFATPVPRAMVHHLADVLRRAGRSKALAELLQRYPGTRAARGTELVVLHLAGEVPAKHEAAWETWTGLTLLRVPYPYFGAAERPPGHLRARLTAGPWHEAELASNLGAIARATLHDKAEAIHDRAVARAVAVALASDALVVGGAVKGGAAGGVLQLLGLGVGIAHDATSHADTRSWRTLPDQVELAALPAGAGPATLELEVALPGGATWRTRRAVDVVAGRTNYVVVRSFL